ncbi:PDZ domain-containing protein [Bacillus timonensis]|nr:PDZ domain-containing protein [Bacillus timonensis]
MKRKLIINSLIIGVVVSVILTFIQLPYYVTKPGMAQELDPLVEVEGGFEEEGNFMLTTVRMGKANVFTYIWSNFNKYYHLYPVEDIRREGESDEEYNYRQLYLMEDSKEDAITVAYHYAEKPVSFKYHGVFVMGVLEDMPAFEKLQVGDRIHQIDNLSFETAEEFIEYVSKKQVNEEITLTFERNGNEQTVELPIVEFPDQPDKKGIGIALVTDKEVLPTPPIYINTEKIGGPSAGLMFSLEIYNQLTEEDMTRGYQIAGTGSINEDGIVGRIGGISQKIVAADKSGVEIFFAPNEKGAEGSNYQEALETVKEIGSAMKIVPVDTFEDALDYLRKLPHKKSN